MNKKRFLLILPAVLLPYATLGLLVLIYTAPNTFLDEWMGRGGFFYLLGFFLLYVITAFALAVVGFVKSIRGNWDPISLAKTAMIIKLAQIPAYICIFILGLVCLVMIFTFFISFLLALIDAIALCATGLLTTAAVINHGRRKKIKRGKYWWVIALQFLFCLDVGATTWFYTRLRKEKREQLTPKPETAYFAGGCFWCITPVFQEAPGVISVVSGYSGGQEADPSYQDVKNQQTGHRETIEVVFNPEQICFSQLFDIFCDNVDIHDPDGQFIDRGHSYTLAVYYTDEAQKEFLARAIPAMEQAAGQPVYISIEPFQSFYPAEEEHQDYYRKHPAEFEQELIDSGRKQA
jgi:peptide-methionine (S)-S-oxide reductase